MTSVKTTDKDLSKKDAEHDHEYEIMDTNGSGEITQNEQSRLLICGAIIAGFLAYSQVGHTMARYIGTMPTKAVGLSLGLSSILSFLYLLTVAAALKHTRWGYIDGYRLNFFQKVTFYDLAVDVLALAPVTALLTSFTHHTIIESTVLVMGLAAAGAVVFYVFPYLWVRYEIEASCPECATKLSGYKHLGRWGKLRPKMIHEIIHFFIVITIFILVTKFVFSS